MKLALILCCSLLTVAGAQQEDLKRDYVPDAKTAVAVAEAVLTPRYGRALVEYERPYTATLEGDIWKVTGALHCGGGKPEPESPQMCAGGTAEVRISMHDAHIVSMGHYK